MGNDGQILIMGRIESAQALQTLAAAASSEAGVEWSHASSPEDIVAHMEHAAEEGEAVVFSRNDCASFSGIREACEEYGLSYIASFGPEGAEGFDYCETYAPGRGRSEFHLDGNHRPLVPLAEVEEAAKAGTAGELAEHYQRMALLDPEAHGVPIAISPGVADAWRAEQAPKP